MASVNKAFKTTVFLQVVDEGRLTLDDLLERYVPGIPNGNCFTIRQALLMTAGIVNYVEDSACQTACSQDPLMPFMS